MVSSGIDGATVTAARVLAHSDMTKAQLGKNELHGIDFNLQANSSEGISHVASYMENHVPNIVPLIDADLNLSLVKNNGLKETNEEVGLIASRPNKQFAKWTRLSRMEVGPNDLSHSSCMPTLGKRSIEDALYVSCETKAATLPQKRSKVDGNDGDLEFISVGVDDHSC